MVRIPKDANANIFPQTDGLLNDKTCADIDEHSDYVPRDIL